MTRHQRAQVVELLRCAADAVARGWTSGAALSDASDELGSPYFKYAVRCEQTVTRWPVWPAEGEARIAALLEAAQRVEEGEWP